jgi:uncharacterized membrane protein YqiK
MPKDTDDQSRGSSSGAGTAVLLVFVGLVFIIGPFLAGTRIQIPMLSQIIISGFGVALLAGGGMMFTITQLYEKATMNEAFVRTGVGGPKVVVDGAAIVIPAIHRVTRVSLETIRLEIARLGEQSFITGDSLHVDVKAQFYIRVNRTEDAIKAAATSLGDKSGVDEMIMNLVGDKLISGLRTVAGRKELDYLHAHVDEYSEEVKKIVEMDLEHNGLFLESVTVTYLNQTPLSNLKPTENIFDALGAKKIAEVTNQAQVEIATIEAKARREKTEQEVARDQYVAQQEVIRAQATAEANLKTKTVQAENERKAAEFRAEQDRMAKIAQVNSERAVELANVEKQKAVEIAAAEQQKAVQAAQIAKDQAVQTATVEKQEAVETANVTKQRAVEIAQRDQQIAVAQKETERAQAEAARIAAEIERARKAQEMLTVEKEAEAERQKRIDVIGKESTAQQLKIEENMMADVAAYKLTKEAQAAKEAADAKAAAARTEAQGKKDAAEWLAQGDKAQAMVSVSVAEEQVKVDKQRVIDVTKPDLEAKSANERLSYDLQVELAKIAADKEVRVESAKSIGAGLAAANLTIYGDPGTFQRMVASFTNGQRSGEFMRGLMEKTPPEVKDLAFSTVDSVVRVVNALTQKYLGKEIPQDVVTAAVRAELDESSVKSKAAHGGAANT